MRLSFHDSVLASDLAIFALYHINLLSAQIRSLQVRLELEAGSPSTRLLLQSLATARRTVESWSRFVELQPVDDGAIGLLKRAHQRYIELFYAQKELREDDKFIQRVAEALKKFPQVKTLQTTDPVSLTTNPTGWHRLKDDEAHLNNLTLPISWETARKFALGLPPVTELVKLPAAIFQAKVFLDDIHIYLNPLCGSYPMAASAQDFKELTTAIQAPKSLEFPQTSTPTAIWEAPTPEELEFPNKLLSALVNTSSMRSLSISLGDLWNKNERVVGFELNSIVKLRPWMNLLELRLCAVPITVEGLKNLLAQLPSLVVFELTGIYLLEGTWEEAPSILRTKAKRNSTFDIPPALNSAR